MVTEENGRKNEIQGSWKRAVQVFHNIHGLRAAITLYSGATMVSQKRPRPRRGIAMDTFVGTFLVFIAAVAAMAVGVIFSGRRIKGSCGGLATWKDADGESVCDACADCPEKKRECELENRKPARAAPSGELPVRK